MWVHARAEAVAFCVVQCPVDSVVEMDKDKEYPFQEYKVRHPQHAWPITPWCWDLPTCPVEV